MNLDHKKNMVRVMFTDEWPEFLCTNEKLLKERKKFWGHLYVDIPVNLYNQYENTISALYDIADKLEKYKP